MKKLIFFIFTLNCIGNKEIFRGNSASIQTIYRIDKAQSIEEFLADESERVIENDDVDKLKELFSKGLRINRKYKGKTLLFMAAESDKKECIRYLLSQGAIISEEFDKSNLKNKEIEWEFSSSVWHRSMSLDNLTKPGVSFKILKEHQKIIAEDIFIKLSSKQCKDEEKYILNRILAGANINEPVEETTDYTDNSFLALTYTHSTLHALASRGTKAILEEFLKRYEADINEVDDEGRTALSWAIEGNVAFAKALIDKGLDPNVHKSSNLSYAPLAYAFHTWHSHEDIEFLEILIQKTSREDILKEALEISESNKFKSNLTNTIDIIGKRITILQDNLKKLYKKEEGSRFQKELAENNTKIRKMTNLKKNLEKTHTSNVKPKNILLTEATF